MRFCDLTLSYTETSGGIRTYLDHKRKYLLENTEHEHILVIPGEEDTATYDGRTATYRIASPLIPGAAPYRFFWRPDKIKAVLLDARPDIIEVGSFYVSPWAAFSYRKQLAAEHMSCVIGGYFHTDIAGAYVGAPMRDLLMETLFGWNHALEALGEKVSSAVEAIAEDYFGNIFKQCDFMMAATPGMVGRLEEYGVEDAHLVPLGVDLDAFHPRHRSEDVRSRYGISRGSLLLIYGGRLDPEKHVPLLMDAFELLPADLKARLLILGEGPSREALKKRAATLDGVQVLPYETDPAAFARLLASADVYVTAGPHETFALSVVEAQASGLPVVGVEAGALIERVPEGLGYLGPVDDAEAMAKNIRRAAANREHLGHEARSHVEARYGWRATFEKLLALYETVVARKGMAFPSEVATASSL